MRRGLRTQMCALLFGLGVVLLASCSPIEQQEVPIWHGLRLNRTLPPEQATEDLAALHALGSPRLSVEFLVEPDSNGLPIISPTSLEQWAVLRNELRQDTTVVLTLVFTHDQFNPLFARWEHSRRKFWFAQWAQQLTRFVQQQQDLNVVRVVVGNSFDRVAHYREEWDSLFVQLRQHTDARLTYAANVHQAERFLAWASCDELGIHYNDTDADNLKVLAQQLNPRIAELARTYERPIFIANANLIGANKLLKLKNRLRFYEDVPLTGLTVNNIFPRLAITDTSRYFFGIANEPEVMDYLRDYIGR